MTNLILCLKYTFSQHSVRVPLIFYGSSILKEIKCTVSYRKKKDLFGFEEVLTIKDYF